MTTLVCRSIYCSMVEGHLNQGNFDSEVIKLGSKLVDASIELHRHVMNNFLPSAVKFHYQFNLRELSNITQVCPPLAAVFHIFEGKQICHENLMRFMHHTKCRNHMLAACHQFHLHCPDRHVHLQVHL